jgi:hypothetical protein
MDSEKKEASKLKEFIYHLLLDLLVATIIEIIKAHYFL